MQHGPQRCVRQRHIHAVCVFVAYDMLPSVCVASYSITPHVRGVFPCPQATLWSPVELYKSIRDRRSYIPHLPVKRRRTTDRHR